MRRSSRAIVSVTNDLYTDQRVNKVCTFLHEQGYEVLLVGRLRKSSVPLDSRPYKTKRMRLLFDKGAMFYACYNFRLFCFLLVQKADLLVSNDLDTLLANHWANKFKRKCRLVYDSHEYFTQVPELVNRPKVQRIWQKIEKKIVPKVDAMYTVNQSIADIYSNLYHREVLVVRNISPLWSPKQLLSKSELGIPENKKLIIMQGAGINIDRGAEEAVDAMQEIDAVLMIVGDGDVVPQLKKRVQDQQLDQKVLFFGKKPYSVMMNYTHYADIGLTLDKPLSDNYKFSLPNKVFDYMHTKTPIVATDIKEVAAIINRHQIGIVLSKLSPKELASAINELINDAEKINMFMANCSVAAQIENWEEETKVLAKIYPKVIE